MANIFYTFKFNNFLLSGTLIVFSMNTIPPLYAYQDCIAGLNDIAFCLNIEKLIQRVNKYKDKNDSTKLIEAMIEIKQQVEGYTGKKIDLDKQLDHVEKEMKKGGAKVSSSEMKQVRKLIKHKEKRAMHKEMYLADCIVCGMEYNAEWEQLEYSAKHEGDKEEVELPLQVTIGVSVALCGLLLTFIPILFVRHGDRNLLLME